MAPQFQAEGRRLVFRQMNLDVDLAGMERGCQDARCNRVTIRAGLSSD
jgi:hypothetical protein